MKDLISIIVPVYNVEDYIDKCMESIINQTYNNIEIIVVDDGSKDSSGTKCDKWQERDSRIKVIHKPNGGLSDARNTGINNATGKYIMFIDSDDFIEKNMVLSLYKNILENDADISICNFYYTINEKDKVKETLKGTFTIEGNSKFEYIYNEYSLRTIISWNKLYKKKLFESIRFPKGLIHEDQYIIADILNKANKISYIMDDYLYHYVQRENSIMGSFNIKRFDIIKAIDKRYEFFKDKNMIELMFKTKVIKVQFLHELLSKCKKSKIKPDDLSTINEYKSIYKKELKLLKEEKTLDFKSKVKINLLSYAPFIYDIIKKMK